MQTVEFTNLEGIEAFRSRWHWSASPRDGMFTAVLRVKNEVRSLPFVLPSLLGAVDRVLIVDNGSDDGTPDLARRLADQAGAQDRLELLEYPFAVARCGSEHLETPPDSVHSLTYFYNWSFSHVRTRYALKWDGDMVLTGEGAHVFEALAWQLEATDATITIPRFPLWVRSADEAFVDTALKNREPWAWPNKRGFWFGKGLEWEIQLRPEGMPVVSLPEWVCFEIKWLDENEFAHWTAVEDFERSSRTVRKRREWEVCQALLAGEVPDGVVPVRARAGEHVIDTVRTLHRSEWTGAKVG
jgi:glycosyltransferase involved in cell wall biosynthesis